MSWQVAAGFVTADEEVKKFHLSPAQQMVLANEYGPDASPFFSAGQQFVRSSRSVSSHVQSAASLMCTWETMSRGQQLRVSGITL